MNIFLNENLGDFRDPVKASAVFIGRMSQNLIDKPYFDFFENLIYEKPSFIKDKDDKKIIFENVSTALSLNTNYTLPFNAKNICLGLLNSSLDSYNPISALYIYFNSMYVLKKHFSKYFIPYNTERIEMLLKESSIFPSYYQLENICKIICINNLINLMIFDKKMVFKSLACCDNSKNFIPGKDFGQGTGSKIDDAIATTFILEKLNFKNFGKGIEYLFNKGFRPRRFWSFMSKNLILRSTIDHEPILGCVTIERKNKTLVDSNFNLLSANLFSFSVKWDELFATSLFVYSKGYSILDMDPAISQFPKDLETNSKFSIEYTKLFRLGPMKYAAWIGCFKGEKKIYRFIFMNQSKVVILNFFNFTNGAYSHDTRFANKYSVGFCKSKINNCIVEIENMEPVFLTGEPFLHYYVSFGDDKVSVSKKDTLVYINNDVICDLKNLTVV